MDIRRQQLIYPQESYDIVGAAMKVHNAFGPGFSEKVYQEALEVEYLNTEIPFKREAELHAVYNGKILNTTFIPDFICYDKIIVELKAVKELDDIHRSQAINYAKVANMKLALLINFGEYKLTYERLPIF